MEMRIEKPAPSEYAPYYQKYLDQVEGDVLGVLRRQPAEMRRVLDLLGEARGDHRYAPGKWTVKESVLHVLDTERVFAYRALCISRGEAQPLPGFDQDAYAANAGVAGRGVAWFADAFERLRAANLDLFESFDDAMLRRAGVASGYPVSVRALLYMVAGHAQHHIRLLETRYAGAPEDAVI